MGSEGISRLYKEKEGSRGSKLIIGECRQKEDVLGSDERPKDVWRGKDGALNSWGHLKM